MCRGVLENGVQFLVTSMERRHPLLLMLDLLGFVVGAIQGDEPVDRLLSTPRYVVEELPLSATVAAVV